MPELPRPAGAPLGLTRRRFIGAGLTGLLAAGCSSGRRRAPATTLVPRPTTTVGPKSITIGYVAEFTGPNSFRGEMVKASMDALTGYLDDKQGGAYNGYTLDLVPADAPTPADGRAALDSLLGKHCAAILWCTPFGLADLVPVVQSAGVPVISVLADLSTATALTGVRAGGTMVFQTALPDSDAFDVLLAYASEDRAFSSAGLLFDTSQYPHADGQFSAAASRHGITNRGTFPYDSTSGHVDLSGPLSTLKQTGCHAVVCWGLADQASSVATRLQILDAKYVDTPTTRGSKFKPMLMGSVLATGDPLFTRLAGDAASRGTISVTSLNNVLSLPNLPIRSWLHDYVQGYNGGFLRGGEAGPAEAVVAVVDAAVAASSTRGSDLVAALEHVAPNPLVSGVGVSFAPDRHLAAGRGDAALLTLDWPPTPYNLGNEWHDVLPRGYQGPTHLVDFTLAANTQAHPVLMQQVLAKRYGTSASDDYQGGDPSKVAACKAVH